MSLVAASRSKRSRRVLVYGAGAFGQLIVREMRANPQWRMNPVAFIDDDPMKAHRWIIGVPVRGALESARGDDAPVQGRRSDPEQPVDQRQHRAHASARSATALDCKVRRLHMSISVSCFASVSTAARSVLPPPASGAMRPSWFARFCRSASRSTVVALGGDPGGIPDRRRARCRLGASADQRRLDADRPAAHGRAGARRSDSRSRLHRPLLGRRSRRPHHSRRQLRTPSRVVSVSPRLAAPVFLPAERDARGPRPDRVGVLGVGDLRGVRHRPVAHHRDAAWRPRDFRGWAIRIYRSTCRRTSPSRSCCTSATCTSGGTCRCWSMRCSRRAATSARPPAMSLVLAGVDRGVSEELCAMAADAGTPDAVVALGAVSEDRAARALPRRGRAGLSVALRRLRPAADRGDGERNAGACLARGVDSGSARRRRAAAGSSRRVGLARRDHPRRQRRVAARRPARRAASRVPRRSRGSARRGSRSTSTARPFVQPDVSVVIVTWNGRQHLDTCLAAVAAQQGVATETILVDNGSTDGTAEFVRDRDFPWVRLVALAENRGFAGGNNAGVARSARPLRRVSQQRHRRRTRAGCTRCLPASTSRPASRSTTSRIVYMHDPDVIDSAGDGMLRWGGAFKRHHGEPASVAPRDRGSVRRLRRRVPDAEGGVRRAWRLRRGLLRVARGRRSVVSRAAARVSLPLCGRRGRPPRWQRDARHRESRFRCSTDSATSSGCTSRTRRRRCSGERCPAISSTTSRQRRAFHAHRHARSVPAREARGVCRAAAHAAQARRRSARRGASLRPRSSRCSRRSGFRRSCARSASIRGWPRSAMSAPEIAAILVNYNAGAELERALRSIADELAGHAWEGVVVDNASTDGSARGGGRVRGERAARAQHARTSVSRAASTRGSPRRPAPLRAHHESRLPADGRRHRHAARGARCASAVRDRRTAHSESGRIGAGKRARRSGHADGTVRAHDAAAAALPVSAGRQAQRRRRTRRFAAARRASSSIGCRARACWRAATRSPLSRIRRAVLPVLGGRGSLPPAARAAITFGTCPAPPPSIASANRAAPRASSAIRAFHESAYLYYATHVAPARSIPSVRSRARSFVRAVGCSCWPRHFARPT